MHPEEIFPEWIYSPEGMYTVAAINLITGVVNLTAKNRLQKGFGGLQVFLAAFGTLGGLAKQGVL